MKLSEQAILRDCLETLKHASTCYLQASLEADSDGLRKTFDHLAIDKSEEKNAVFNLMHQSGMYKTKPADAQQLETTKKQCDKILSTVGQHQAIDRELGRN